MDKYETADWLDRVLYTFSLMDICGCLPHIYKDRYTPRSPFPSYALSKTRFRKMTKRLEMTRIPLHDVPVDPILKKMSLEKRAASPSTTIHHTDRPVHRYTAVQHKKHAYSITIMHSIYFLYKFQYKTRKSEDP